MGEHSSDREVFYLKVTLRPADGATFTVDPECGCRIARYTDDDDGGSRQSLQREDIIPALRDLLVDASAVADNLWIVTDVTGPSAT